MDQLLKTLTAVAGCLTLIVVVGLIARDARYPAFLSCASMSQNVLGCAAEIYGGEK